MASPAGWMLVVIGALAVVPVASAQEQAAESARGRTRSRSVSVGAPNRGRLLNAAVVRETPHILLQAGGHPHGTEELVGMIERAAERIQREMPGPKLVVGGLSRARGGRLRPHNSHQSGRDADLGFFMTDEDGRPVQATRFVELDPRDQCGRDREQVYCLDAERTFAFIAAMLEDPEARVQWVLMAADIQQRVLAGGRRLGASDELLRRVELATDGRDGSESHRNHLHVRISCPADDLPRCQENTSYRGFRGETRRRRAARVRRRRGHR